MPTMLHDKESILYLPDSEPSDEPYWRELISIGFVNNEMTLVGDNVFVFEQEDKKVAAIEMPDPVSDYGSPLEEVITTLRAVLLEEDVTEIVENVLTLKRNLGILKDDPLLKIENELDLDESENKDNAEFTEVKSSEEQ